MLANLDPIIDPIPPSNQVTESVDYRVDLPVHSILNTAVLSKLHYYFHKLIQ